MAAVAVFRRTENVRSGELHRAVSHARDREVVRHGERSAEGVSFVLRNCRLFEVMPAIEIGEQSGLSRTPSEPLLR